MTVASAGKHTGPSSGDADGDGPVVCKSSSSAEGDIAGSVPGSVLSAGGGLGPTDEDGDGKVPTVDDGLGDAATELEGVGSAPTEVDAEGSGVLVGSGVRAASRTARARLNGSRTEFMMLTQPF